MLLGESTASGQWFIAKFLPGKANFEYVNWYGTIGANSSRSNPRLIKIDSENNTIATVTTNDGALPGVRSLRSNFAINPYIVDVYVIKVNPDGEPIFSTYLGGSKVDPENNPLRLNGRDYIGGLDIDNLNNIYISGESDGKNFPTTEDAMHPTNIGRWDHFFTKFSPTGELLYSTLLGGPLNDRINTGSDVKNGLSIGGDSLIYVLGYTDNPIDDFANADLAIDRANDGDEFLLNIFDSENNRFIYSSFLGPFEPRVMAVDNKEVVHMIGHKERPQLVNQLALSGDQFIMSWKPLERNIRLSSYIPCDRCEVDDIEIDFKNNVYFTISSSNDMVTTTDLFPEFGSGKSDVYFGSINTNSWDFNFAYLIGGAENDRARGMALNQANDQLYLAGFTLSPDWHTTTDAIEPSYLGAGDGYLVGLQIDEQQTPVILDGNPKYVTENSNIKDVTQITDVNRLLSALETERDAVSADGVSKVILKLPFAESIIEAKWTVKKEHGTLDSLWGSNTVSDDQGEFFVGLYTPPKAFPEPTKEEDPQIKIQNGIASVDIPLKVTYKLENDPVEKKDSFFITLYRPPVVLVHGTFDDPINCWKTGLSTGGNGLYQELIRDNFKAFTCDYTDTNGNQKFGDCGAPPIDGVNTKISSFECNKRVVYDNPGGIKNAISFYRDTLNIAATQADAIGHSMGGVLIRVYASEKTAVNKEGYNTDYRRTDNFMEGDVNRIISMASTHHGSDVAWFLDVLSEGIPPAGSGFFELLLPVGLPLSWMAAIYEKTGAVEDQVPKSRALNRIGATKIPAHAMTFYINSPEDVRDNEADMDQFYLKRMYQVGMLLYFYPSITDKLLTNIALEWGRLPMELKIPKDRYYKSYEVQFLDTLVDDLEQFRELYKRPLEFNYDIFYNIARDFVNSTLPSFLQSTVTILQYESAESSINDFDNDEHLNFINRNFEAIKNEYEVNVTSRTWEEVADLMNRYRFLLFKNDWNDGTVRYDSQTGSLDELRHVSRFTEHLHSFAPRYPDAMRKVLSVLKSGLKDFSEDGFPTAGKQLPIWLPDLSTISDPDVIGCDAACWSGMVPDHAMAWARVADSANVIVLNRPVNPDATPLIFENASTKGMNLKGKSSDWGPQKGLIAVNQRFSKMWNLYNEPELSKQVGKFDKKVKSLLKDNPREAIKRQLEKEYDCPMIAEDKRYKAWIAPQGMSAEDEIRFTSISDESQVYLWSKAANQTCPLVDCIEHCNTSSLDTFFVLANPNPQITADNGGISPVYTADYDLLAIGFFEAALFDNPNHPYRRPDYKPPEDFFDCDMGIMFDNQVRLLNSLNQSVKKLGYKGGNVAHHGPENQFTDMAFSSFPCAPDKPPLSITANPYFDYPITAFEPDDVRGNSAGIVRTIQMGPPGYRDINLKRYIADVRRKGFDLIANPNSQSWRWEHFRSYTYEEGFDDRDYPDLPPYPEELPRLNLQKCIDTYGCLGGGPPKSTSKDRQIVARPKVRFRAGDTYNISPNPAGDEPVTLTAISEQQQDVVITIFDILGRKRTSMKASFQTGFNQLWIDTQYLESGRYSIVFNLDNVPHHTPLIISK